MDKGQTLEDIYQKKTQLEHILLRPDTYIGSEEESSQEMWILPKDKNKFEKKTISYVQGLFKIFDEILVNAADNNSRDSRTNCIKVSINENLGEISVENNGPGIPVEIHKKEKIYIPQLIFGELLTGSNFNDDQKKITGGRNGFGAKLANIFSSYFCAECCDKKRKKIIKIEWRENMTKMNSQFIDYKNQNDYVKITFRPDLKIFKQKQLTPDTVALFKKRVYDIAGVLGQKVKVYLNQQYIDIKDFKDYTKMYFKENTENFFIYHKQERWEVILTNSEGTFEQVSFVNSINTSRGGTHVNQVINSIIENLKIEIEKRNKKLKIKNYIIKNNLCIFINSLIENPKFDTQTKEYLTLKSGEFGSQCELTKKFFKELQSTDLIQQIIFESEQKLNAQLKKHLQGQKKKKILGMEKLEDANKAGTFESQKCLLILTEGDSAKSLAMAGIEIVGRDYFGCFPLRGKLLNVREARNDKILKNEEIQDVIKIMGLQVGKTYETTKDLRYGGVLIMADQDVDGSHIKGLIINFIAHFWPSLIQGNTFVKQFITPIIKCFKKNEEKSFYSLNQYKDWAEINNKQKKWRVKYYKGLGTSSAEEAKDYFDNFNKHKIDFIYLDNIDLDKISLLFDKKKANLRKEWLQTYNEDSNLDYNVDSIRYKDFIDKEMIHFSMYDNQRSISNLIDGLKPGKRKILYGCFLKNIKNEIKVSQLTGYVAEKANYHHGEQSLQQTIVDMAQNYVGSNNINLLKPIGQFGTRSNGGKNAASARYIFTSLNNITRYIFIEDDDHVLDYQIDDGDVVEPKFYVPILPMVLVNGAEGIGSGWSTYIPNFNPREIVQNLLRKINGGQFQKMLPFYNNYQGEIIEKENGFESIGKFNINLSQGILNITELPICVWTRKYKNFLESLMEKDIWVEDILEYHKTTTVDFELKIKQNELEKMYNENTVVKKFKLSKPISSQNYVLFDKTGLLKRYKNEIQIMEEFYEIRLQYYEKRKKYLLSKLKRELVFKENKYKFIVYLNEDKIILRNKPKKEVVQKLIELEFTMEKDLPKIYSSKLDINQNQLVANLDVEEQDDEEINQDEVNLKEFNYLTRMTVFQTTMEEVQKIKSQIQENKNEYDQIFNKSIKDMWKDDLMKFLDELTKMENEEKVKINKADAKIKIQKEMHNDKKKKRKKKPKNEKQEKNNKVKKNKNGQEKKDKKEKKIKNKSQEKERYNIKELLKKDIMELDLDQRIFLEAQKNSNEQKQSDEQIIQSIQSSNKRRQLQLTSSEEEYQFQFKNQFFIQIFFEIF